MAPPAVIVMIKKKKIATPLERNGRNAPFHGNSFFFHLISSSVIQECALAGQDGAASVETNKSWKGGKAGDRSTVGHLSTRRLLCGVFSAVQRRVRAAHRDTFRTQRLRQTTRYVQLCGHHTEGRPPCSELRGRGGVWPRREG
jgi:hypothetical protein